MPTEITIAHDFTCPWCWVGFSQANRLKSEFDVEFYWKGFPLWPEELAWPEPGPKETPNPDRPVVPSRFELALAAEGLEPLTSKRPSRIRTINAHMALEFARDAGCFDDYLGKLYVGFWVGGLDISDPDVLVRLATRLPMDQVDLRAAISQRKFADRLVNFDDDAYAAGIYNVPTFIIGGERYAEQPYIVLKEAANKIASPAVSSAYRRITDFPEPRDGRPFVFMNMISTIDGKILSGERDEHVMDLGSKVDHATMRHLESLADAVMIGAGSLRATPGLWYASELKRFVVTGSGNIDRGSRFFTDAPDKAFVVGADVDGLNCLPLRSWDDLLAMLRRDHGVNRLLIEGGSELNAQLLELDLVDEIFMTLAPKIKLGADVPTIADGSSLSRDEITEWELISAKPVGNEIFVRYRRRRS
jgi:predicted DsbA family dithiol-disulfide isomerase/riboflavin biosynthesis pyrimidine reductase